MGGPPQFEGHSLDDRTAAMVVAARVVTSAPLVITQGSYNTSVSASGGTHAGGGAVDFRARDLSAGQIAEAVLKLRHVGFAAWHRTPDQGNWMEHIHCIAIGCPDLSASAANQVVDYREGRNGLRSNRADDGPRTYVGWTWEKYKSTYPDLLTEDTLSAQDVQELKNFIEARTQAYASFDADHVDQMLAKTNTAVSKMIESAEADVKTYVAAATTSVKDYVRQTDNEAEILAAVTKLADQVTALTATVAALPKA